MKAMPKKLIDDSSKPPEITLTKEYEAEIAKMLDATRIKAPDFWSDEVSNNFYIPVDDGQIRVFHIKPKKPISKRPLVLIPGWGGIPQAYEDFYEPIHEKVECFFIETREKGSSILDKTKARMDMSQKAKDVQDAINYLKLRDKDFVLHGTCWGSSIILNGLIEGILTAPTILATDPMHTLWFPKWILRYVSPILPIFIVNLLRPIIKRIVTFGMKEKVQKQRTIAFIDNAVPWKWKKGAEEVKDFELYGNLHRIKEEVFVINGTIDRIHNQTEYPKIANQMPNGRFIFMKTDESNRERLMGLIAREFTTVLKDDDIPQSLSKFEKILDRES